METVEIALCDLRQDRPATIVGFACETDDLETRLREIGFAEGDSVTALHFGLFGRNPMSIRVNGAIIAVRRQDVAGVRIRVDAAS